MPGNPFAHPGSGLVQDCSISSALAMEILQSYTKLEKMPTLWKKRLHCNVYEMLWRKMSISMDFTDRYVLENISNRI